MRRSPIALAYLLRRESCGLLLRWSCLHLALCLPALLFALTQEPRLLALAPLELLGHLFIEIGPSSLLLGLPLCCALCVMRLRADGDLAALSGLPMRPFWSRLVLIVGLLPFFALHGLWLNAARPNQRLGLHAARFRLPGPQALTRMLPSFSNQLGRVAVGYEGAHEGAVLGLQLLNFANRDSYLRLTARRMELHERERAFALVFLDGTVARGQLSNGRGLKEQELGFERLELSIARGNARTRGSVPAESLASRLLLEHAETILARAARLDPDQERRAERRTRYEQELVSRQLEQWGLWLGSLLALFLSLGASGSRQAHTLAREVLTCSVPLLLAFSLRPLLLTSYGSSGLVQLLPPSLCCLLVVGIFVRRP